jgi:MarR family transcriptional regulator, transcriptional regulator for hemolysin
MATPIVPDPERSLGFLIHDVARLLRRSFNRGVLELGLTQTQWRAIAQLSRNEGINQVTLADILEVQPISLARLLDRMQEAGIIERRPDPNDRRAVQLYLTDAAKPILEGLRRQAARVHDQAVGDMPEEGFDRLIDALQVLKRNLLAADSVRDERRAAKASSKV